MIGIIKSENDDNCGPKKKFRELLAEGKKIGPFLM